MMNFAAVAAPNCKTLNATSLQRLDKAFLGKKNQFNVLFLKVTFNKRKVIKARYSKMSSSLFIELSNGRLKCYFPFFLFFQEILSSQSKSSCKPRLFTITEYAKSNLVMLTLNYKFFTLSFFSTTGYEKSQHFLCKFSNITSACDVQPLFHFITKSSFHQLRISSN